MKVCQRPISRLAYALAALTLCGMAACTSANDDPVHVEPGQATYVSLSLTSSHQNTPRRTPAAGENGDGLEHGQDYENLITNITAFFYNADGPNASATTPIAGTLYCDATQLAGQESGIDSQWRTRPIPVAGLIPGVPYHVLIVANAGDLRGEGLTTLGALQKYVVHTPLWTQTEGGTYSTFFMASANGNEKIDFNSGSGTEDDPVMTDRPVGIERLAARIDYRDQRKDLTTPTGKYRGTVSITRTALANVPDAMTHGTYLFKRVTPGKDLQEAPIYLGDELTDAQGYASNYVIDPFSARKTVQSYQTDSTTWLDRYTRPLSTFTDSEGSWYTASLTAGTPLGGEAAGYSRIGYALENVTAAGEQKACFCTVIVFEASFVPQAEANTYMQGYQAGETFFDFDGTLYRNLTQAMEAFYQSQQADWNRAQAPTFDTGATWADVQTYISELPLNDPAGWREYLRKLAAGHNPTEPYDPASATAMTWAAYLRDVLQVTESATGVTTAVSSDHGMTTRRQLHATGTRLYYNGRCYYTYLLRHADDGSTATDGIMEHAVVRNNVYKLDINAIRDLGNDVPTDSGGINITVAVKNWSVLPAEQIEL